MKWFSLLNMEEVFLITLGVSVVLGIIIAVITHFVFNHDHKENDDG